MFNSAAERSHLVFIEAVNLLVNMEHETLSGYDILNGYVVIQKYQTSINIL